MNDYRPYVYYTSIAYKDALVSKIDSHIQKSVEEGLKHTDMHEAKTIINYIKGLK